MKELFAIIFLLFLWACEPSPPTAQQAISSPSTDTSASAVPAIKTQPDCPLQGEVLEGNQHWFADKDLLICISADSSTYEEGFGMSHRILQVWDTRNCQQIHQQTLPVNNSPDFPYYLSEKLTGTTTSIACCQGFDFVFCYDLETRRPIPKLKPEWSNERASVDAQSGLPMGLHVIGDVLMGYARDYGAFAFDLSDRQTPTALMPIAEYQLPEMENYSSLFCIPEGANSYKLTIPGVDQEGKVQFKLVSPKPLATRPKLPANARNNRFIVLSSDDKTHLAIDMKAQASVDLPSNLAGKGVQDVLKWLKQQ